jgi:hypothetical protein
MKLRVVIVLATLLTYLVTPTSALAVNDSMATATVATAANGSFSDTVTGDSGGAFRWFRIDYAGGAVPIPVTMRAQPGRGTGGVATGFKIYGPTGLVGEAVPNDTSTSDSTYAFTLANTLPGAYYVQVYNFIQGMPLNFQLTISGLAAAAPAQPAPVPPAAAPAPAIPQPAPSTGPRVGFGQGALAPGARVALGWADIPSPTNTDWIGLFPVGAGDLGDVGWMYTSSCSQDVGPVGPASGACPATIPSTIQPGAYELRLYAADTVTRIATSAPVPIGPAAAAPAPAPAPAAAAPAPAAPDNTTADHAIVASGTTFTSGGTLAARTGFNYFYVDYPGGRTNMTLTLGYSPIQSGSDKAVGFNLYRPDTTVKEGAVVVGFGSETGRNESSATSGFTYSGDAAERFLLQVFNYLPNTSVNYTLIVSGLAGPVADAGDVSSPDRAFVLNLSQPAARGTLPGDRTGRFHYYLIPYPGSNREVRVTVSTEPNQQIGDGQFGFNLYNGATQVGTTQASQDSKSRRTATLTINQADAPTLGVQIYNYSNTDAKYAITVSGL